MINFESQQSDLYRREEMESFFGLVQRAKSFFVIGAPSMGKSRFLETVTRFEIRNQ
jgi:hypothetical protein